MSIKIWIDMDREMPNEDLRMKIGKVLEEQGIITDQWGRCKAEVSEETFKLLTQLERDYTDDPKDWDYEHEEGLPGTCHFMDCLTDEEYEEAHVVEVLGVKYKSHSWVLH